MNILNNQNLNIIQMMKFFQMRPVNDMKTCLVSVEFVQTLSVWFSVLAV